MTGYGFTVTVLFLCWSLPLQCTGKMGGFGGGGGTPAPVSTSTASTTAVTTANPATTAVTTANPTTLLLTTTQSTTAQLSTLDITTTKLITSTTSTTDSAVSTVQSETTATAVTEHLSSVPSDRTQHSTVSEWTLTQTAPTTPAPSITSGSPSTSDTAIPTGNCDQLSVYGVVWPLTPVGEEVEITCLGSEDEVATARRRCYQDGNVTAWDDPDMTECYSVSNFSDLYLTVESLSINLPTDLQIAYELLTNTTNLATIKQSSGDVIIMTSLVITSAKIAKQDIYGTEDMDLLHSFLRAYLQRVSDILEREDAWSTVTSSISELILSQLLWDTETLAREYTDYQMSKTQNDADIPEFPPYDNIYIDINMYINETFEGWKFTPIWQDEDNVDGVDSDKTRTDNLIIPPKAVPTDTRILSLVGIAYRNLHSWFGKNIDTLTVDGETEHLYVLNSQIISASISPSIHNPPSPIEITLHHEDLSPNYYNPVCVYWKFLSSDGSTGVWSTDGCKMKDELSTNEVTVCQCYHLTNFAILMQHDYVEIDKVHDFALSIITYIGCSISLTALSITWVIFQIIRSISCERNSIHKNLVFAIGTSLVVFLVGINATQNDIACTFIAVLLHYFLLCSFAWMLVEGLYLYTQIVKVFTSGTSKMRIYYIIGYVSPGLFVGISAAARPEGYGTPKYCWLASDNNLTWAFLGPVLGIIAINIYLLSRVMKEIITVQGKHVDKSTKLTNIKNNAKATAILLPILGLTWIFGIFAINEQLIVFQYLFTIFNAFQGLFIFVFHCAMNSEVRNALKRKQKNWALTKSSFGTPSVGISPDNTKDRSTMDGRTRTVSTAAPSSRHTTTTSVNVTTAISVSLKTQSPMVVTNLEEAADEYDGSAERVLSTSPSSPPRSQHPAVLPKDDRDRKSPSLSNELEKYAVIRSNSAASRTSSVATKMTDVSE